MKKKIVQIIFLSLLMMFTISCFKKSLDKGQQYKKKLIKNFTKTKKIDIKNKLINANAFVMQIQKIKETSPNLYFRNKSIYQAVEKWLKKSDFNELYNFGIDVFQMKGIDNYGNVKLTGYYTPIIKARKTKTKNFQYPIYSLPKKVKKYPFLPDRKKIYDGILDKKYILAYSNSLIDNFIMEIQGSAFIDYENKQPLSFFSYAGNNGWPYKSIGQILINRGQIQKKNISIQTIKNWCYKHSIKEIKNLFEENKSFVFFSETKKKRVYGASAVPLIAKTSVAADTSIIKKGSVILLQIPVLNKKGIFINQYEIRLVIVLDVGGAIKGQHFDIYEGIGEKAGQLAGFYNHYGYAWILRKKQLNTF